MHSTDIDAVYVEVMPELKCRVEDMKTKWCRQPNAG